MGKLMSRGGVTGGLPCAYNGGNVAISDSTVAAQVLRMEHNLTSGPEINDDFCLWIPLE
jgi:hypothetical protein